MTTGEMYLTHVDAVVGEVKLSRGYSSARIGSTARYGVFGLGWNSNLEKRLRVASSSVMEVRAEDGNPTYYGDTDADGVYEKRYPYGTDSWLQTVSGGYRLVFRSGGAESYDTAGKLVSEQDGAGIVTSYGYDSQGRVVSITKRGRSLSLSYGSNGRPDKLEGPDGALATYSYSSDGKLEGVDYADGTGVRYGYGAAGRLLWVKDAQGRPLENHDYDSSGRATTSEIGGGREKLTFSYASDHTAVTDALGNSTVYWWKEVRGYRKVYKLEGACTGCGLSGDSQEWTYQDKTGTVTAYKDGAGKVWSYSYDPTTLDRVSETDPVSRVTTYGYDSSGNLTSVEGPGGTSASATWVAAGPESVTEKLSSTENRTTSFSYGTNGRPSSVTDPRGKITSFGYDSTTDDLVSVTDPLSHTTTFEYDSMGRQTSVTDALDHSTVFEYDLGGRVTKVTGEDGSFTRIEYDGSGRRSAVTDPLGRATRYGYDPYGRLVSVVDALNGSTRYGYDEMSHLTSLTDAKNQTTSWEYDSYGRVKKTIYPGGAFETVTYDSRGTVSTHTDRNSVVTTYTYDDLGRLLGKSYSDGTTPAVSYTYDAAGRLATAGNGTDSLAWTYDLVGQVLSEQSTKNASLVAYTYDLGGNRLTLSLDGVLQVSYGYDDAARLSTITKGSDVFSFSLDAANRRTGMSYPNGVNTTYGYDSMDRLLTLQANQGLTPITSFSYSYDPAGDRTSKAQLDYAELYTYDALSRLLGVNRITGPNSGLQRFGYDPVGNRITKQADDSVLSSTYNEKNQLLSSTAGGKMLWRGSLDEPGTVSFTSATVNGQPARMLPGNVFEAELQMASGTNTVTLQARDNSGNQTTKTYQVTVTVTASGATYSYGLNGNLAQKVEGSDTWSYSWNARNQLLGVTLNGNAVAAFAYDPVGRRVEKAAGAATTAWTYDGHDILRETVTEGENTTVYRFIHGPGIDEPLRRENATAGAMEYFHADGLGSVTTITDSTGAVVHSNRYDAWGNLEAGTSRDGYAFTGREWESLAGLQFSRARFYDPSGGRFISEDPIKFDGGLNFYRYVSGNPTSRIDPDGTVERTPVDARQTARDYPASQVGGSGSPVLDATIVAAAAIPVAAAAVILAPALWVEAQIYAALAATGATGQLQQTATVASHLSTRPYVNSPLTVQEIMAAAKPVLDPQGVPGALRWDVPGSFNESVGTWQLVVDSKTNTIFHFLFASCK